MNSGVLIPVAAILVGVPGFVVFVTLMARHARKTKELQIREQEIRMGIGDADMRPVVAALSDDLHDTRARVAELQDRLDFAERVLAAGRVRESGVDAG